jgi:hypothetical protein
MQQAFAVAVRYEPSSGAPPTPGRNGLTRSDLPDHPVARPSQNAAVRHEWAHPGYAETAVYVGLALLGAVPRRAAARHAEQALTVPAR